MLPLLMVIILFVAAAINVILETIRKVAPPFAKIKSVAHTNSPSLRMEVVGIILPPFNAKLTELNNPPIIKKNKLTRNLNSLEDFSNGYL